MSMSMQYAPPGHKELRNKKARRERASADRLFQRQLVAVKDGRMDIEHDGDMSRFLRKYQNACSQKIKKDLRAMWQNCGCDMELAATCMVAKEIAFKESITEGEWLSMEQLTDTLKSAEHAENYAKAAVTLKLTQFDNMRKCKTYFYMKRLERMGSRKEAVKEQSFMPPKKDAFGATTVRQAIQNASSGDSSDAESSDVEAVEDGVEKDNKKDKSSSGSSDVEQSNSNDSQETGSEPSAPSTSSDDADEDEEDAPPSRQSSAKRAAKPTHKQAAKSAASKAKGKTADSEGAADNRSSCRISKATKDTPEKDRKSTSEKQRKTTKNEQKPEKAASKDAQQKKDSKNKKEAGKQASKDSKKKKDAAGKKDTKEPKRAKEKTAKKVKR
eukprot:TRINITY_DN81329_c0_g1_i1.p1 TRINITY_DN81329_c0_g1~~TRINITY_DN81329_c0_g1_i1.p1  ORF type:complete len:385 (-),score=155.52 TRINITY_DN81329_c0_g1_i1:218-1372(-)